MKVLVPTHEEIAFKQCLEMLKVNPLTMNTYYTQLFATFKALLGFEDIMRLNHMIKDIEEWLKDDLNDISLMEAETRMYNNLDLLSGFEVNGQLITQMDIIKKLDEVKSWLTAKLYQYLPTIRFTAPIRIE